MSFAKVAGFAVVESAAAASPETAREIPHTKPMGRPWNRGIVIAGSFRTGTDSSGIPYHFSRATEPNAARSLRFRNAGVRGQHTPVSADVSIGHQSSTCAFQADARAGTRLAMTVAWNKPSGSVPAAIVRPSFPSETRARRWSGFGARRVCTCGARNPTRDLRHGLARNRND